MQIYIHDSTLDYVGSGPWKQLGFWEQYQYIICYMYTVLFIFSDKFKYPRWYIIAYGLRYEHKCVLFEFKMQTIRCSAVVSRNIQINV